METSFEELKADFILHLQTYFERNILKDSRKFFEQLNEAFVEVRKLQENTAVIPIQQVCICFLNTGMYFEEPVIRVYFYEKDCIWKKELAYKDLDVEWIIKPVQLYKRNLNKYAEDSFKTKEWINVELRKMARTIFRVSGWHLKYELRKCCMMLDAQHIFKDSFFCVSLGEYMDWQMPVYCEGRTESLIESEESKMEFQTYHNDIFNCHIISDKDISSSIFKDCVFKKCKFVNCKYDDVLFMNCSFKDVEFDKGTMFGTSFDECNFKNTIFRNVSIEPEEIDFRNKGMYKLLEFIDCEGGEDGVFFIDD